MEEVITGFFNKLIYRGDGDYVVFLLRDEYSKKDIKCSGKYGVGELEGKFLSITGKYTETKYGTQFNFTKCSQRLPTSKDTMIDFLGNGFIKGIGPKTAEKIVSEFGSDTWNVMDNFPERLLDIKGITSKKLIKIKESWEENSHLRKAFEFLSPAGVTELTCKKLYDIYKDKLLILLRENCYRLCFEVDGFGFIKADAIALGTGENFESVNRINGAIAYAIYEEVQKTGGVCLEEEYLISTATKLLKFNNPDLVIERLNKVLNGEKIKFGDKAHDVVYRTMDEKRYYYLKKMYDQEIFVAQRMATLTEEPTNAEYLPVLNDVIKEVERESNIKLSSEQIRAISEALGNRVYAISGGPGTGKTTIQKVITKILDKIGREFLLLSPTGKASRRQTSVTGYEANTIHYSILANFGQKFSNVTIIIDESSMIGLSLLNWLFSQSTDSCNFIFFGDVKQLVGVEPGDMFHKILTSKSVKSIFLNRPYRQGEGSPLSKVIGNLYEGVVDFPYLTSKEQLSDDFFFCYFKDADSRVPKLIDLYERLYKENPDTQILIPKNVGSMGCENINKILQSKKFTEADEHLNYGSKRFYVGDRVMITENNKEAGVSNGDSGIIKRFAKVYDEENEKYLDCAIIEVDGEQKEITNFRELALGYAITVHKSQGSEYHNVIFCVYSDAYILLDMNMLLTGVSRAKSKCVVMGEPKALKICEKVGYRSFRLGFLNTLIDEFTKIQDIDLSEDEIA